MSQIAGSGSPRRADLHPRPAADHRRSGAAFGGGTSCPEHRIGLGLVRTARLPPV